MSEWLELDPARSRSPVTGQLLQSSPRAKNVYSLITTFREIQKYPWALCLPAVSLEKLPKSVRLTGNPWDLTGLLNASLTLPGERLEYIISCVYEDLQANIDNPEWLC